MPNFAAVCGITPFVNLQTFQHLSPRISTIHIYIFLSLCALYIYLYIFLICFGEIYVKTLLCNVVQSWVKKTKQKKKTTTNKKHFIFAVDTCATNRHIICKSHKIC